MTKVHDIPSKSSNWAGYVNHGGHTYGSVGAEWVVPSIPNTRGRYASTWVGIGVGGSVSNPLIQAGNDETVNADGSKTYDTWYEIYTPRSNQEEYTRFNVRPGDRIEVDIDVNGRIASFFIEDVTAHKYQTFNVRFSGKIPAGYKCSTAEYIEENQGPNQNYARNMSRFGKVTFTNAYSYTMAGKFLLPGKVSRQKVSIWDRSGQVASVSKMASPRSFSVSRTHVQ